MAAATGAPGATKGVEPSLRFTRCAPPKKINEKKEIFSEKTFSEKIWNFPLALFCSWGIFLPVAGDEPDGGKRRSKLNESSLKNAG